MDSSYIWIKRKCNLFPFSTQFEWAHARRGMMRKWFDSHEKCSKRFPNHFVDSGEKSFIGKCEIKWRIKWKTKHEHIFVVVVFGLLRRLIPLTLIANINEKKPNHKKQWSTAKIAQHPSIERIHSTHVCYYYYYCLCSHTRCVHINTKFIFHSKPFTAAEAKSVESI